MEQDRLLRKQLEAEANSNQSEEPTPSPSAEAPIQQTRTPRQVSEQTEEVQQERGFITEAGEFLQDALNPANILNAAAAGFNQMVPDTAPGKPIAQFLDDNIRSQDEQDEMTEEIISGYREEGNTAASSVISGAYGARTGVEAGIATPVTLAARLANQDSSAWSDPPEIVKGSLAGELSFEVARMATIALGGAAMGLPGAVGPTGARVLESAAETINQKSADDLLLGRELAVKVGEIANSMGYDGEELTEKLIKGEEVDAQLMVAVAGFMSNYALNFTGEQLLKAIGKAYGRVTTKAVYHGTLNPEKINETGFKVGLNQKSAGALGQGVYVTPDKPYAEFFAGKGDLKIEGGEVLEGRMKGLKFKQFNSYTKFLDWADENIGLLDNGELPLGTNLADYFPGFDGVKVKGGAIPSLSKSGLEIVIFDPKKADEIFSIQKTITEKVAETLGKSPDEVQKQLDDVILPPGSKDYEPHELTDIDSVVPVARPTKDFINEPALVKQALERKGLADDALTYADRDYFTNLRPITDEESYQMALKRATETLKPLVDNVEDRNQLLFKAANWLEQFRDEVNGGLDLDRAVLDYPFEMLEPIDNNAFVKKALMGGSTETIVREASGVTPEGMVAGTLLAEEVSVRLSQAARQLVNLDNAGVDFSAAVETFLDLENTAQTILIPLRRGKRKWSLVGQVQQRRNLQALRDADISDIPGEVKREVGMNAPGREFETTIQTTPEAPRKSVRELWEAYQAGDLDAGNTLKTYFATIAYAEPKTAISSVENLSNVLMDQLKKGNKDATRSLVYSYYLTRLAPITASLSSNIFNLVSQPIGSMLRGETAYGMGQFIGGLSAISDSVSNGLKTLKSGQGLNQGSKLGDWSLDTKKKQQLIQSNYEAVLNQLNEGGAGLMEKMNAYILFQRQMIATSPLMTAASKALMATDQFAQTTIASQIATGRAWKKAAELGVKRNDAGFKLLVQDEFKKVFKDGLRTGKITDGEVLELSKKLTFQSDIPDDNWLDRGFQGLNNLAANNAMFNFISPFTRVTYHTMEAGGVALLGSLGKPGRYVLENLAPRYRKTLNGELGEAAEAQLKSNLAFAQAWAMGVAAFATGGLITGHNPPNGMPKTSFIIPMPGTEKGWISIPYNRMEPIATPTALIADLATGIRDDVIAQGAYDEFLTGMLYSLGISTLDKSFMTSMTNSAALLDLKSYNEGSISKLVGALAPISQTIIPTGGFGGLARMATDWMNPYRTINRVQDNPMENLFLSMKSRFASGMGNPIYYNPLTGKPELKLAHLGDNSNLDPEDKEKFKGKDWWRLVFASAFNELAVPGDVQEGDSKVASSIYKNFNLVNYDRKDFQRNLRTFNNIPLSAEEISILSKDLYDVATLDGRLEVYFESKEFKTNLKGYREFRSDSSIGKTSGDTRANFYREKIIQDINRIFSEAKEFAATNGRLMNDPDFVKKFIASKSNIPLNLMSQPLQGSTTQNLLIPTR